MPNKTWKQFERRVAAWCGTVRNSLSGSNSKATASDSLHPDLYIEAKHSKSHAVWTLFDQTRPKAIKERKLPLIALARKGSPGFILCLHSDDLDRILTILGACHAEDSDPSLPPGRPGAGP